MDTTGVMFDLHDLVGVDRNTFRKWDGERQRRAVADALNYDRYAPPCSGGVTPADCTYYNPGIAVYRETHDWGADGWEPVGDTTPYRSVPAYLPTDDAIQLLTDMRLVEIGAGSGYWAHVVGEAGGEIMATDPAPPEIASDAVPPATTWTVVGDEDGEQSRQYDTVWAEIRVGDHRIVQEYPERDILVCHPEACEWTVELLDLLHVDQRLVVVAEWYPGADAVPEFYRRLDREWQLVTTFPVLDWATMHARGYVFSQA